MTSTAAILLLLSAFLYAFWNYRGKAVAPSATAFMISASIASLLFLPFLLFFLDVMAQFTANQWLLLISSLCQAVHFGTLGEGYRQGDMTLMYPLARALPVLVVLPLVWLTGTGGRLCPSKMWQVCFWSFAAVSFCHCQDSGLRRGAALPGVLSC